MNMASRRDRWPLGRGFERYYGFMGGDTNQWEPELWQDNHQTHPPRRPEDGYHLTEDLTDKAIEFLTDLRNAAPDKPFFIYFCTGAGHAPHHAPKEWIDKYRGKFDMGWERARDEIFKRQKEQGIVPPDTQLTPRPHWVQEWDSLSADEQRLYARMMEVFAAYGAKTDYEMGRIVDAVKQLPDADNTIIIYIAGDNGSSAEGGIEGSINENLFFNGISEHWQDNIKVIDELGGPKHFNHFPSAWAHAMDTPFQWTKQIASYFGGTRNPLIISWPSHIKDRGGLRSQFTHVIDIVPTLYEVIGITPPDTLNGIAQSKSKAQALPIRSMMPARRSGTRPSISS
jgi:arylsulfatase